MYALLVNYGVEFPPLRLPLIVPSGRHVREPDDRKSDDKFCDAGAGTAPGMTIGIKSREGFRKAGASAKAR